MLPRLLQNDDGAVTAEFAILLPAVIAVLGLVISAILLATTGAALSATAAEVARLEARGDTSRAAAIAQYAPGSPVLSRSREGGVLCVTLTAAPVGGLLQAVTLSRTGCAALADPGVP